MTPTLEEVRKVADKCGIALAAQTFQTEALQAFAQHWMKAQRESDAAICDLHANEPECPERAQYCAESIRNNTGE